MTKGGAKIDLDAVIVSRDHSQPRPLVRLMTKHRMTLRLLYSLINFLSSFEIKLSKSCDESVKA